MVDVASAFILVGTFLGIGFLADLVFERTGVPDLLVLIFLGVTVGPVLGMVDPGALTGIAPFFAALAVAVILFDGGLNLPLRQVRSSGLRALILAFLGVTISILFVTVFASLFLGWRIEEGALLGAVLGGSSSAVVIPLVTRIKASQNVATLLSLESVFSDTVVVVVAISLMWYLTHSSESLQIGLFTRELAGAFLVGAIVGLLGGIAWIRLLKIIFDEAYRDILTLGIALSVYGLSEHVGGNGAISAFVFGLVLGNGKEFASGLGMKEVVEASAVMKRFQSQISFLIRTFFFAFLGIIFVAENISLMVGGLIISLLLLGGRFLSVWVSTHGDTALQRDRPLMTVMLGRGLAAAVLANLAAGYGVGIASVLRDITVEVIVVTILISAVGIYLSRLSSEDNRKSEQT